MDEGVVGVHVEFGFVDVEFGGGLEGGLFEGGVAGCTWMRGTSGVCFSDVVLKESNEVGATDVPRGEVLER